MAKPAPASNPLSEEEYDLLARILDIESPFDIDGYLGLVTAVVVAPGMVPPSIWMRTVLPHGFKNFGSKEAEGIVDLLMRLYNEVVHGVNTRTPMMPEEHEVDACVSFAEGFLAGAQLDPEWVNDDDHWTFAAWAAFLAGENDLVTPATTRRTFEEHPEEARAMLCREMGSTILSTHETFLRVRGGRLGAQTPVSAPSKVGRNDACPCGSGKKNKKCCAGTDGRAAHR